jgi:predicted RNase H-like nuclease
MMSQIIYGRNSTVFVGLDLAWGSRDVARTPRPSGLAVVDRQGRLIQVGSVVTDSAITEAIAFHLEPRCVVAIDAPLKITNQRGNRLAETQINKVFQPFDAGAHSANANRFSFDPRGARIARSLELDIDPHSQAPKRAIEVYPHPATIALFGLDKIFKYKSGSVDQRKLEFRRLLDAIENLRHADVALDVTACPDWGRLRRNVEEATRPVDLNRAEDPIDAVLCAYIALFADRRPDQVTVYGDYPSNGYILTPSLPDGVVPAPRTTTSAASANTPSNRLPEYEYRTAPGVRHLWKLVGDPDGHESTEATRADLETAIDEATDNYCSRYDTSVLIVRGGLDWRELTTSDGRIITFHWTLTTNDYGCSDCGYDTWDETYRVGDPLWTAAGGVASRLCIGCLELRLGRALTPDDFVDVAERRFSAHPSSQRLRARRDPPCAPRPNITNVAPIGSVDLRAFDELGDPYEILACLHCLPWHAEVVRDPETDEVLVREWHAVECEAFQDLISGD